MALGVPSLRDRVSPRVGFVARRSRMKYASCRDPLTALRSECASWRRPGCDLATGGFASYCGAKAGRWGKERFYRAYTEEGLAFRRKRPWSMSSLSFLSQARHDVGEIEREARASRSDCDGVHNIGQRIGRVRRGPATSESPERDSISKPEITLARRELGLCPDLRLIGWTAIIIEKGPHERGC